MRALARRRYGNMALAALGAGAVIAVELSKPPLVSRNAFTGWVLAGSMLFLLLFNLRKKIPVLPLMPAAIWLQLHVYVGAFAATVFVAHTGLHYPGGVFNQLLWWFFVALTVSGLLGIWAERSLTPHLRDRGEAILFERIPAFRTQLEREAETLVARSAIELGSPLLVDFYCQRVAPLMGGARDLWAHLLGTRSRIDRVTVELRELERYLNPEGRATLDELVDRIVAKNNLDHQRALVLAMRSWLFVHIPLACGICLLVALHIVLVYAFGGF